MSAPERLFHGIPLPSSTRDAIARALAEAPEIPGRPVPPANWHVTIRFLGATDADRKHELVCRMSLADLPPAFQTPVTAWGVFPRPARASVLWVGVEDPTGRLATLARTAERVARAAGFEPENRPFTPHVTIARFRQPVDLRSVLARLPSVDALLEVDRLVLFRSSLGSGLPKYEEVAVHLLPAIGTDGQ